MEIEHGGMVIKNRDDVIKAVKMLKKLAADKRGEWAPVVTFTAVLEEQRDDIIAHIKALHEILDGLNAFIAETQKWSETEHKSYMRTVEIQRKIKDLQDGMQETVKAQRRERGQDEDGDDD